MKPITRRWLADRDVEEAVTHYLAESPEAALRFIDSLEHAFDVIGRYPDAGSPRHAHELDVPGLRSIRLSGFPFVVFYVAGSEGLDVWRVLHMRRDVPPLFREG